MADVYMYAAALYCEECGEQIRERLAAEGKAPADPSDESSYDSDEYPKGPFADGGGESDSVQHCDSGDDCLNAIRVNGLKLGAMLENPLTAEGEASVIKAWQEGSLCAKIWREHYGQDYGGSVEYPKMRITITDHDDPDGMVTVQGRELDAELDRYIDGSTWECIGDDKAYTVLQNRPGLLEELEAEYDVDSSHFTPFHVCNCDGGPTKHKWNQSNAVECADCAGFVQAWADDLCK